MHTSLAPPPSRRRRRRRNVFLHLPIPHPRKRGAETEARKTQLFQLKNNPHQTVQKPKLHFDWMTTETPLARRSFFPDLPKKHSTQMWAPIKSNIYYDRTSHPPSSLLFPFWHARMPS
ncbi:hypothetical protein CDAR_266431 [Caerostris darwini]|uniref:Uncharacterized protein n=1 Tax=Caerostris darwini TaxID=1538125 RepID=A0AAV4Q241_9ARAC|nr:hypothetical protein CDAR_266431 [Caerostris darwini]